MTFGKPLVNYLKSRKAPQKHVILVFYLYIIVHV
jgi:hypothetical protein